MRGIQIGPRDLLMLAAFVVVFLPLAIVAHAIDGTVAIVRGRR